MTLLQFRRKLTELSLVDNRILCKLTDSLPDEDSFPGSREQALALITTPPKSTQPRKRYVCEECGKAYTISSSISMRELRVKDR